MGHSMQFCAHRVFVQSDKTLLVHSHSWCTTRTTPKDKYKKGKCLSVQPKLVAAVTLVVMVQLQPRCCVPVALVCGSCLLSRVAG